MRNHTGWPSVLSVLVLFVLSARIASLATPSPSLWNEMIIKHKWDAIPDNWVSLGHPPNGTTIELHIVLKANRENALIDALHEVSHPRHPKHVHFTSTVMLEDYLRVPPRRFRYGAHLSREQAAELAAPHPDTLKLVFSWLEYNDVPTSSISMTHGGSWLTISGVPVLKANKILGASYEFYHHVWANATILRTVSYSLPASLHTHVKMVAPTTAFTSTRLLQQTPLSHSGGEAALENVTSGKSSDLLSRDEPSVVPQFLRWLYRMPLVDPAPSDNTLGIAGFANEFPSQLDLFRFMTLYRTDVDPIIAVNRIMDIVSVNDGVVDGPIGRLGSMDTQFSVALTFPTQIKYYTIGGSRQIAPSGPADGDYYLEWLRYMFEERYVPLTISVPYSIRELELPAEYATTLCDWFRDLGVRGVSILVASGDEGIGASSRNLRDFLISTTFPASCTCGV